MKTIIVDDDLLSMKGFEIECENLDSVHVIGKFCSSGDALSFAKNNRIDLAFLDIEMPEMDGIELGKELKKLWNDIIIIFVTSFADKSADAFRMKADYIVYKPYERSDIEDVIKRINLLKSRLKKRVYCKTFGRFDVFIDGKPLNFKMAKSKELFALCVSRNGGVVSTQEIVDKLWEDFNGNAGECSTFRTTAKALKVLFLSFEIDNAFFHDRGRCYINTDVVDCDYYEFLNGDENAICDYQGEFMSEYSWAESVIFKMDEKKKLYAKRAKEQQ